MHKIIQALHARTPPPALSPSSTAMKLDASPVRPPPPPSSPPKIKWVHHHPAPSSGVWHSWLMQALDANIPATRLKSYIQLY